MSDMSVLTEAVKKIIDVDLFERDSASRELRTGLFVGNPFYLDYTIARVLVADAWKLKAKGLPQGAFLLAYYQNEPTVEEALLLRVLGPCNLPTDGDITRSMIEYYKDDLKTTGENSQLDTFTRYEFSFSGLECRILGSFYKDHTGRVRFGADVENFYSAHNYSVVKPNPQILEAIVNFREDVTAGGPTDIKIGKVRYSSSRRFQIADDDVPVYARADDFIGKRTALFGMTRTGKSNSVKKIIEATVALSDKAPNALGDEVDPAEVLEPFTKENVPKYPVGQIVFDINGEYANPNLQDEGTAIFELFSDRTVRYSVIEKPGFRVMKVNFYEDYESGFELVRSHLADAQGNYIDSFRAIDLTKPHDYDTNFSSKTRYERKVAAYLCCLYAAGFPPPPNFTVRFSGNKDLNQIVQENGAIDPSKGITLEEATNWFTSIWDAYNEAAYFTKYKQEKGHEWADEDLKAILVFLTRKRTPGKERNVDGYIRLRAISNLHTATGDRPFEVEITENLRAGNIVLVDLSQGDPGIQSLYSERITQKIFRDAMDHFIANSPNNFIQFYFEEAHNLFPKRDNSDLSQIYNRLAKEGAKLHIGLLYATQEVSSISANILKNTQNWFIAHLNNADETREIEKYYDFGDFTDSLVRFSASSDKGFVRMKTYSNPFVVPVQVDRFPTLAEEL